MLKLAGGGGVSTGERMVGGTGVSSLLITSVTGKQIDPLDQLVVEGSADSFVWALNCVFLCSTVSRCFKHKYDSCKALV